MTPEHPTAVVSALRREIRPLLRRARLGETIRTSHGRFVRGRLGGQPVVFGWTGDGRRSAEDGLRALLAGCGVGRLLFLGVAGGLSPALAPGQLVLAAEVRDVHGAAPAPDADLSRQAIATGAVSEGMIYSSESIVGNAADKARLWQALRQPATAVVDLETAAWARVAAQSRTPYLAVRAVSDVAGEDLPLDFERFRDAAGRVRTASVAYRAMLSPSLIRPLRHLERRVDSCAGRLASWAVSFLT